MQPLQITDERTLQEASAYLHDAVLQRRDIQHDQAAKTVTLDVWRELWEETTSERVLLIFHRWKAPHIRCLLKFDNVSACQTEFTDELERYQICRLQFDPRNSQVRIVGVCCFEIRLTVDSLKGSVSDLGERTTERFNKTTIGLTSFRK